MEINIQGIKNQILKAYQYAAEKAGILAGHSVKVFKQGHAIAQQDARVAAAVVCVSNVLFFEITFGVATLSDYALSKVFGADSELTARSIWAKRFVLLTIVISAYAGMNVALARGLQSKLSTTAFAAISTASCFSYFLLRLWRVRNQQPEPEEEVQGAM